MDRQLRLSNDDFLENDDLAAMISLSLDDDVDVDDLLKAVGEGVAEEAATEPEPEIVSRRRGPPPASLPNPLEPDVMQTMEEQKALLMKFMETNMRLMQQQQEILRMQKQQHEPALQPLAPMTERTTARPKAAQSLSKGAPSSGRKPRRRAAQAEPILLQGAERRAKIEKWLAKRARSFKKGFGDRHVLSKEQVEHRRKLASNRTRVNGRFVKGI